MASVLSAQICRFSAAGLNRSRRVMGAVHAECPSAIVHTSPFGNWGVTSNFGTKQNAHQFQGWCHDSYTCDDMGRCFTNCGDGWYEWNSCTDVDLFRAPNCTLYNANECTEQSSTMGVNVHGTRFFDLPVPCPSDSDGDGRLDRGGCAAITTFTPGVNFMSLYELDPGTTDDLVQTLYFPPTPVPVTCDVWGCAPAGSEWVLPSFFDGPSSPQKVSAEMATAVNWGVLLDPGGACRLSIGAASTVSAASFSAGSVAPESIASVFGEGLAPISASAEATPLPTSLGSTSVRITDRTGTRRSAPIFFVSPKQVNYLVPAGTAAGTATLQVYRGDFLRASGTLQIDSVAPALFTANADGRGVASAIVIRTRPDGSQTSQLVFQCGDSLGSCVPVPIDLGPATDRVSLVLFGTGIRGRSSPASVTASAAAEGLEVQYAGPQGPFLGLDQVNIAVPRSLQGRGEIGISVKVDGRSSNVVSIQLR